MTTTSGTSTGTTSTLSSIPSAQLGGRRRRTRRGGQSTGTTFGPNVTRGGKRRMKLGGQPGIGPEIQSGGRRRTRRGGDDTPNWDIEMGSKPTEASNDEYNALDAAEKGEAGTNVVGGSRKHRRRGRKSRKGGRKTRRHRRRSHRRH